MTTNPTFKIGIIIGSTRVHRVGPQIARFILDILNNARPPPSNHALPQQRTTIDLIDLNDYNLPIFNEPGIPKRIKSPEGYEHEHTRVWARHISSYDAFVFLSAQRNWGIPAELKNAIDYLFNEWKGKPALIISYGGHGGEKCAEQIGTVLGSVGMRVVGQMVNMSFESVEGLQRACGGEDLGLDAEDDGGMWAEHRGRIAGLFWDEMVGEMLVGG